MEITVATNIAILITSISLKANLFQLADIFKKCSLQIQKRFYFNCLAISIKTQKLNVSGILSVCSFKKIKRFEKVMPGDYMLFTIGLRCVQPESKGIDPLMDPGM